MLPLVDDWYDAMTPVPESEKPLGLMRFLDARIVACLIEAAQPDAIAYVETDYFGGEGAQGAVVVRAGQLVSGPVVGEGSINAALRLLGVQKGAHFDEFAAIRLQNFRSNQKWLDGD